MTWMYKGKEVVEIPAEFIGFVYLITKTTNNRKYIGKKLTKFKSSKNFNLNDERYKPVNGNPTGGYIYTDHDVLTGCDTIEKKTNWWECGQIEQGLMKLESNIINLGFPSTLTINKIKIRIKKLLFNKSIDKEKLINIPRDGIVNIANIINF